MHRYDDPKFRFGYDKIMEMTETCRQWGKWGPNDEWGTINYIGDEERKEAAKLVKRGQVFSLALNFDDQGPQRGLFGGRWNPIHTMLATGTDAVQGTQVVPGKEYPNQYADDAVSLPLQCGTQWDALGHVFNQGKMWNGYDATQVDTRGANKNAIDKFADKMVGRGVLLDVARYKRKKRLADGYGITIDDLENTAKKQGVDVRRGDFVLINTGQMAD